MNKWRNKNGLNRIKTKMNEIPKCKPRWREKENVKGERKSKKGTRW